MKRTLQCAACDSPTVAPSAHTTTTISTHTHTHTCARAHTQVYLAQWNETLVAAKLLVGDAGAESNMVAAAERILSLPSAAFNDLEQVGRGSRYRWQVPRAADTGSRYLGQQIPVAGTFPAFPFQTQSVRTD